MVGPVYNSASMGLQSPKSCSTSRRPLLSEVFALKEGAVLETIIRGAPFTLRAGGAEIAAADSGSDRECLSCG